MYTSVFLNFMNYSRKVIKPQVKLEAQTKQSVTTTGVQKGGSGHAGLLDTSDSINLSAMTWPKNAPGTSFRN